MACMSHTHTLYAYVFAVLNYIASLIVCRENVQFLRHVISVREKKHSHTYIDFTFKFRNMFVKAYSTAIHKHTASAKTHLII